MIFITLRDGSGFLQSVLTDKLTETYNAVTLATEASVLLYGTITKVPEGKTVSECKRVYVCKCVIFNAVGIDSQAPGGIELQVDFWELIGSSPPGGADTILNEKALPDVQLDNRHIMIRGENVITSRSHLFLLIQQSILR